MYINEIIVFLTNNFPCFRLDIQHYTQQLAKDTSTNLKDLSKIPLPLLQSEQRQWKMQKERLTDEFATALNHFQQAQRNAHTREKEILQRERADSGLQYSLNDPSTGGRKFSDHLIELQDHTTSKQQTQQMLDDEVDLQALEERAQAIRQLESDIMDVNQIFKDLGQLVHEQGETVDSIEAHVELASTQISEGAQQLRMAAQSQTKLRKKKLCLLGIFVTVLLVLIFILWLSFR